MTGRRTWWSSLLAACGYSATSCTKPRRTEIMRVVRLDTLPKEPLGEATPIAGWTGGSVTRTRQTIIPDNASDDYRCSVVNFSPGATTGWHAHSCDQILVVTAGSGVVATEHEERDIT